MLPQLPNVYILVSIDFSDCFSLICFEEAGYYNILMVFISILVCKSCVVKHLEEENTCPDPDCQLVIHQSHPLNYINFDRTMQDMVYKLVPGLEESKNIRHAK